MSTRIAAVLLLAAGPARAWDSAAELSFERRLFASAPLYPDQRRETTSAAGSWELRGDFPGLGRVTLEPFGRVDAADPERTHADLRQFFFLRHGEHWEFRGGVDKVFWGVSETVHLVDIVNQNDGLEGFDGEDKLGQPLAKFSVSGGGGILDLYFLPLLRERRFPGPRGRLRSALIVRRDRTRFEAGPAARHLAGAARVAGTLGDWDLALSQFRGTGREPTLLPAVDASGTAILIPFYETIDQTGLEAQWTSGSTLWKFEGIRRAGQGPRAFFAAAAGFEHTLSAVFGTRADLGLIGEWLFDDRGKSAPGPANGDLAYGFRIGAGDAQGTELLAFVANDYRNATKILTVEASRRLAEDWKAELQGFLFLNEDATDPVFQVRKDDFLQATLTYFF